MTSTEPILKLDGIFAGYGKMTILNGITARIRRGAITTVIGPNGAGKSTFSTPASSISRKAAISFLS